MHNHIFENVYVFVHIYNNNSGQHCNVSCVVSLLNVCSGDVCLSECWLGVTDILTKVV